MPTRKLAHIINETPELRHIVETSRRTAQLQRVYQEAAPAELSCLSRVAYARGGILYVAAGNGAVAAKLRHLAPSILAHFRQQGCEFNSIRIVVQVGQIAPHAPVHAPKPLTESALAAISATIAKLPPSPLREALERLARGRSGER